MKEKVGAGGLSNECLHICTLYSAQLTLVPFVVFKAGFALKIA